MLLCAQKECMSKKSSTQVKKKAHPHEHPKLNQWFATAICGNDILSSTLYVSGIAIIFAGVYAPIVLLCIGVVLFLYKSVYTEVVEALPVNGGAYNSLLNSTSKVVAATAGITTFLSYVATAVISGKVAIEYLHTVIHGIPIIPGTIVLLLVFALLVISGLKDSAKVALGIFSLHVLTLIAFLIFGIIYYFSHGSGFFMENLSHTTNILQMKGGLLSAIFLGFSASLLGVSGFESSANFVEEQAPGVFRKTLRNMLVGVAFFNPTIALVVLNSLPFEKIAAAKDFLLADAAFALGGNLLQYLVAIDAFLVLSGAVLTAFVGVGGLLYRMASDGCLPDSLTTINSKSSYPKITILFLLLCTSILIITKGELLSLAGVYTISFLGVMSMFAIGNLLLKQMRTELKRTYSAPVLFVIIAFCATFSGIIGNILIDVNNLKFFLMYFIPAIIIVLSMVYQDLLARVALKATRKLPVIHQFIENKFTDMTHGRLVVFIHHINRLHAILDYVHRNEVAWDIVLIHCADPDHPHDQSFEEIKDALPVLRQAGFYPHFNIQLSYKDEPFGPNLINEIAREFKVRKNRILIGSIHHEHPYDYDELGGVRIIF
jgi:amino acid transporter